ncbi:hypothetical protein E3P99_00245 [Wallemia hederae]|uniref:Flavodoxin-like domain-containing protein n=1 Tax=Wallemia hederae TaxID=1540922 RepID=A0A4T0FWW4_9BASI|nr:hypothetical protein E3P99_00245 [Wallemia hederae]
MVKVAQIEYSTYSHIYTLGDSINKGLKEAGVQVDRFRVPETLPDEVLTKMGAPKDLRSDIPLLDDVNKLAEYDGLIFGFPTRYGNRPAQVSTLFDSTGGLWAKGALSKKTCSFYISTATVHGGQEITHTNNISFAAHHGMIYVPTGYIAPDLFKLDVNGGSAWGASTIAGGDGSRQPSEQEHEIARIHGKHFGSVTNQFAVGAEKLAARQAGEPAAAAGTEGAVKSAEKREDAANKEAAKQDGANADVKEAAAEKKDEPAPEKQEQPAEDNKDAADATANANGKEKKGTFKKLKNRISKIL